MKHLSWILALVMLAFVLPGDVHAQTTFNVTASGQISYTINGASDPTLNLTRGLTYTFNVNAVTHPFWIKSVQGAGTGNAYNNGVTNNGDDSGTITFTVPLNAPSTLFYNCEFHPAMTGQIHITGPTPTVPVTWGRIKALYRTR